MRKLILWISLSISFNLFARVHDFETTRLKSTAGAGVGSILVTEGAILNPAPLAFFQFSTLHLQKVKGESQNSNNSNTLSEEGDSLGIIFTDAKNRLKGSFAYFKQEEGLDTRKRFSGSFARPIGEKSSIGMTYRFSEDRNQEAGFAKDKYHQIVIGASHVVSSNFSVGAIVIDPLGKKPFDRKVILGGQYTVKDIMAFIVDISADYKGDPSKSLGHKLALQVKFFKDLFFRAGLFNDKKLQEKGNGIGAGWASPNFIIEAASKLSKPLSTEGNDVAFATNTRQTSLSLTYRF